MRSTPWGALPQGPRRRPQIRRRRPAVRAGGTERLSAGEVEYAILLFNGDGVPANEVKAAQISAAPPPRATPSPRTASPACSSTGRGVPANKIEAAAWHILAAAQGLADPWLDDALKDLTTDDRARAERVVGRASA